MFNKALIASDGSEPSKNAIRYYLELAPRDTEVIILTVTHAPRDPRAEPPDRFIVQKGQMWELHQESVALAKNLRQDVVVNSLFKEGLASDIISETAEEANVDLIVMGNRGLGGFKEWLLGSNCKAVVDKTHKPIMIIKM